MSRRSLRYVLVVMLLAVTVIAATAWAKSIHVTSKISYFNVDAQGQLQSTAVLAPIPLTVNETTRAYHGTGHATVTNLSGKTVTLHPLLFQQAPGGITSSTYTVKPNGAAKLTVHGVFPPAP